MLLTAILPRVEDPIPDTIGVGALFGAAGAGESLRLWLGRCLASRMHNRIDGRAWVSALASCGRRHLRERADRPATMKTMHRTSKAGLATGVFIVALGAIALAALTRTGAGGTYFFLFAGMFAYMVFLMWPDRTRFRSRPIGRPVRRSRIGREPR